MHGTNHQGSSHAGHNWAHNEKLSLSCRCSYLAPCKKPTCNQKTSRAAPDLGEVRKGRGTGALRTSSTPHAPLPLTHTRRPC